MIQLQEVNWGIIWIKTIIFCFLFFPIPVMAQLFIDKRLKLGGRIFFVVDIVALIIVLAVL